MNKENTVWVFNGETGRFPSAIFSTKELAEEWIKKYKLSGTLTKYPVDVSVYDYTIINNHFKPKEGKHLTSKFIGNFSSATQEHYHYDDDYYEENEQVID